MKLLPRSFFARNTVTVAKELIGKILSVNGMQVRIVETEAYGRDPASHAFKKTERSKIMYDTYGYIYVYLIYGMYECVNVTTEKDDAGAVLLRAVEPLTGISRMQRNRQAHTITELCSGPGKLCQALGITRKLNGLKVGNQVRIYDDGYTVGRIGRSSRIGIQDALHLQWRFFVEGNEYVSKVKINK